MKATALRLGVIGAGKSTSAGNVFPVFPISGCHKKTSVIGAGNWWLETFPGQSMS